MRLSYPPSFSAVWVQSTQYDNGRRCFSALSTAYRTGVWPDWERLPEFTT
jgi:hypothetical protein